MKSSNFKDFALCVFLLMLLGSCAGIGEEKKSMENENTEVIDGNGASENKAYDSEYAKRVGADDYGMRKFVIAFLKRGPNRDQSQEEAQNLQKGHMANINRLAEEGKLVLAGPFFGDGDLRGLYVFASESIEEAEEWTKTDPAIQAGSLVMELYEWYGSAAMMDINDLHFKAAKIPM